MEVVTEMPNKLDYQVNSHPSNYYVLYLKLTQNNFIVNDINYLEIKGSVMLTICAPAYANILMGKF